MKSLTFAKHLSTRILLIAVFIIPLMAGFTSPAAASGSHAHFVQNAVYTMTNSASGNEIVAFQRGPGNSVTQKSYSTGGLGSGAGLGSQGAVVLSENNRWLFAVNAGSNEISVFAVRSNGIKLTDVIDSGGTMPISLTVRGHLLYVVNGGGSGNISGFLLRLNGTLLPLPHSTQPLSNGGTGAAPGPAQISFSTRGDFLVVTEKGTNLIDTFALTHGFFAEAPITYPSAGMTPFGFAFDPRGHLIVSEAFGGAADAEPRSLPML